MAQYVLGVDLGGTKILTALVDRRGRVLERVRMATPQTGPDTVVAAIVESVGAVVQQAGIEPGGIEAVGVGAPGPSDPVAGVVFDPPNLAGWHDVPLAEMLSGRLGIRAYVENDANAAALGERWTGAGHGIDDIIYITVSTGIGGGLIFGGRLYHGTSGTAGEIGHMVLVYGGPLCPCGRRGCLEAVASGTAIAREARAVVDSGRATALSAVPRESLSAADVAQAAREGDAASREIFARAAAYVGTGVTNLVNLLNPAMVIIGGGVAKAGDLLFAPVRRIVLEEAFERPATAVQIVPAALGDSSGAIGAAAVAIERGAGR